MIRRVSPISLAYPAVPPDAAQTPLPSIRGGQVLPIVPTLGNARGAILVGRLAVGRLVARVAGQDLGRNRFSARGE